MPHEIHTSERRSYRACRRRWNWIFRDNWYPKITAKPLEFGVCYHKAMETFYDPEKWNWPIHIRLALATKVFVDECEKQRRKFLLLENVSYLEDEVQKDYDERLELGKGMLAYYAKQVEKTDFGFEPIKVEVSFSVPILNPDTGEQLVCRIPNCRQHSPGDAGVVYAGRVDMLARDLRYGGYWIYDWKTAARISIDDDEFLYLDDQVGSYPWALKLMLGLDVHGFIYHEQRKGFPKPPVMNQRPRLGRMFSVSKQADVDYNTFLETVEENDPVAFEQGLYDEYLDWLQEEGPKYFHRYQIHKSEAELEETGKMIFLEAQEIVNPSLSIYPSPGRFSCKWCAFRQPCLGQNMHEDYQYTLKTLFDQREYHYWVQEENVATTEKRGRVATV